MSRRLKVVGGILILGVAIGAAASVLLVVVGAMPDDSAVAPGPIGPKTRALPNVVGLSLTAAEVLVRHPGRVQFRKTYSKASRGTVLRQDPYAGALLTSTDAVILQVAKPLPEVPPVVGVSVARAKARLRNVGYRPKVDFRYSSRTPGTVLQTLPHAGKGLHRVRPSASMSRRRGRSVTQTTGGRACRMFLTISTAPISDTRPYTSSGTTSTASMATTTMALGASEVTQRHC
jgi:beta-lactam-binding protein with PASTA domain